MTFSQIICSSPRHHEHQSEYTTLKRTKRLSHGYHYKSHEHSDDEHSDSHDESPSSSKESRKSESQESKRDSTLEQQDDAGMTKIRDRGDSEQDRGLFGASYSVAHS